MYGEIQIQAAPPTAERVGQFYLSTAIRMALAGCLLALAVVPYLPVFVQPFVSDDYIQLDLGRKYGPVSAWGDLATDVLYRCRATSIVITHWTEQAFGIAPLPFYATSVLLHVVNTFLVLLAGWKLGLGGIRSYLASAFFAVLAVHQEAVMWYAALPELLLFFFCALFLLSWNSYLRRGNPLQYGLALLWFVLALLSKEAGVVLVPVAAAMLFQRGKSVWQALPMGLLAIAYTLAIFEAESDHLHLNDGTFSLQAPFLAVWARSAWRMFGVWGLLGLVAVAMWQRRVLHKLAPAAVWSACALLPFSFLLYMPVVPSRHTYLASAGVGFFVAAGLLAVRRQYPLLRWLPAALVMAMVLQNTGYIWTKKRQQFLARAEVTEGLLRIARETTGPIYVQCLPYTKDVASKAIEIVLAQPATRLVWSDPPPGATTYCAKHP